MRNETMSTGSPCTRKCKRVAYLKSQSIRYHACIDRHIPIIDIHTHARTHVHRMPNSSARSCPRWTLTRWRRWWRWDWRCMMPSRRWAKWRREWEACFAQRLPCSARRSRSISALKCMTARTFAAKPSEAVYIYRSLYIGMNWMHSMQGKHIFI